MSNIPQVRKRRLYDRTKPKGYLESFRSFAENNQEAVEWFLENHKIVRKAMSFNPERINDAESLGMEHHQDFVYMVARTNADGTPFESKLFS